MVKKIEMALERIFYAIKNNYVSITPLKIDLTSTKELDLVSEWIKEIN